MLALFALVYVVVNDPTWIERIRSFVTMNAVDLAYQYGNPANAEGTYQIAIFGQAVLGIALLLYLSRPLFRLVRGVFGRSSSRVPANLPKSPEPMTRPSTKPTLAPATRRPERKDISKPPRSAGNQARAALPTPSVVSPRGAMRDSIVPQFIALAALFMMAAYIYAQR